MLGRLVVDGIATGRFEIQIEDVPQAVAVARAQDAGVFAELAFEVSLREPQPQEMAEPHRFGRPGKGMHRLVNSSITVSMRNFLPSCVRSMTKS